MSATPSRRVPVSRLRDAVRQLVAETSTHQAAESIGLSQTWVRKFLAEAEPYDSTLDVLHAWYARHLRERADAALSALVEDFSERDRAKVRENVRKLLREAHREYGTDPPAWLSEE